jgi:hypothetical protein
METQTMVERPLIFSIKKIKKIDNILVVRWGGFGRGIKWDAPSSFGLWAWPLEASIYAQPKPPIPILYWLFSTHFFGLSIKFGHSIPRPLDLDNHSVK